MRHLKIFSRFLCLVTMAVVLAQPAWAQEIMKAYTDLDTTVKMTKEEYNANAETYEREVPGEKLLSHKYSLPKGWEDISGAQIAGYEFSSKVETILEKYVGLPNMYARSSFNVFVLKLDREINLSHWYHTYMSSRGYSVFAMKDFESGKRVEAESIKINSEATFVVRSVAVLTGDKVLIAEYSVPDTFWDEQRDEAVWSIASFDLVYTDDATIEPHKEFSILDIVKFNYPASWEVKVPRLTVVDELSAVVKTHNIRGELDGRIDSFYIASHVGGTREENLESYKAKYSDIVRFQIGDHIETIENVTFNKTINAGRIDIFKAMDETGKSFTGYEIWLAILESDVYDGYVFLSTIGREYDFLTWSKNQRSFKIMVESMALHGQPR